MRELDPTKTQSQQGEYSKFFVHRRDGRDREYGDRQNASYFVLDLTYDPYARDALRAYAESCRERYPLLSEDLFRRLGE